VKKVVVGHDAVIAGEGWFLDRIIVHVNVPQCVKRYVFPCNRSVTAAAAAAGSACLTCDDVDKLDKQSSCLRRQFSA